MKQFVAPALALSLLLLLSAGACLGANAGEGRPQTIWGDASTFTPNNSTVSLGARQTIVLLWR